MPIDECRVTLTHRRTDIHSHSHTLTETHEQTNECTQYRSVINKSNAIIIASRWQLCDRRKEEERERAERDREREQREIESAERERVERDR